MPGNGGETSAKWHADESAGNWVPDGYISPVESGTCFLRHKFEEGRKCNV
jgi:hypothetical protein